MEIKNIGGVVNAYNKVKMSGSKIKTAPAQKKTDKIEFNFARSVEAAKADLISKIDEDMSADKISVMTEAVNSGDYDISPESVAEAILMF